MQFYLLPKERGLITGIGICDGRHKEPLKAVENTANYKMCGEVKGRWVINEMGKQKEEKYTPYYIKSRWSIGTVDELIGDTKG